MFVTVVYFFISLKLQWLKEKVVYNEKLSLPNKREERGPQMSRSNYWKTKPSSWWRKEKDCHKSLGNYTSLFLKDASIKFPSQHLGRHAMRVLRDISKYGCEGTIGREKCKRRQR